MILTQQTADWDFHSSQHQWKCHNVPDQHQRHNVTAQDQGCSVTCSECVSDAEDNLSGSIVLTHTYKQVNQGLICHPLLQEKYTGVEINHLWNIFFCRFLPRLKARTTTPESCLLRNLASNFGFEIMMIFWVEIRAFVRPHV